MFFRVNLNAIRLNLLNFCPSVLLFTSSYIHLFCVFSTSLAIFYALKQLLSYFNQFYDDLVSAASD